MEIKGGVEVARHDLSARSTTILGRAVDMVHIPLHHQSISRQHARIAFDSNETPWLRDLQSAHGTMVNKRRLPAQACGKQESNSKHAGARGVILKVGDMIKFGASTRFYTLEGPPPGATKEEKHLEELNKQRNQAPSRDEPAKKDDGISWGMNMGDEGSIEPHDNKIKTVELDPSKIPEKYRKELDKIQGLKYKLANLENEDSRIRRKGSELSDGQQKQLDRNAEREAALRKMIREREERLHDKLNYKSNSTKKRSSNANNYDEEDDDFFDRTKNDNNATELGVEDSESEETLTLKWKKFVGERQHLSSTVLAKAKQRVDTLRQELKSMQDSEESFFIKNDLQLALEAEKKAESMLSKANSALDEIEKLLKVVNPKLQCDRTLGYIGKGSTSAKETKSNERTEMSFSMPLPRPPKAAPMPMGPPSPMGPPAAIGLKKPETTSMPPPPSMQKDSQSMAPPNKRKRVIGPAAVPPSNSAAEDRKPPPSKAPRTGTLAFLDRPTSVDNKPSKDKESKTSSTGTPKPFLSEDSYKIDVWTAPKGQDGSGKTKLNEKFAGRY